LALDPASSAAVFGSSGTNPAINHDASIISLPIIRIDTPLSSIFEINFA
jgi:hypothetical protein